MKATGRGDVGQALELHRAGRLDDAEAAYLSCWRLLPTTRTCFAFLGFCGFSRGGGMRLWCCLRQAVDAHPDFLDGRRTLALVLGKIGRWEEALVQHAEAVRLAPGDASILNDFGCALLEAGRLVDAAEMLRLAVDLDREHCDALTNLGGDAEPDGEIA